MIRLILILILILMSGLIPLGFTASTASAARNWECDELTNYPDLGISEMPDDQRGLELFEEFADTEDAFESMRPFEIRYLSEFLEDWAKNLDELRIGDVPRAACEFHNTFVQFLYFWADVTYEVSSGNSLQEEMWHYDADKIYWAYELADKLGFERCGEEWTEVFSVDVDVNEGGDEDGPGDVDVRFL